MEFMYFSVMAKEPTSTFTCLSELNPLLTQGLQPVLCLEVEVIACFYVVVWHEVMGR